MTKLQLNKLRDLRLQSQFLKRFQFSGQKQCHSDINKEQSTLKQRWILKGTQQYWLPLHLIESGYEWINQSVDCHLSPTGSDY